MVTFLRRLILVGALASLGACAPAVSAPPARIAVIPKAIQSAEAQSVMDVSQLIIAFSVGAGPGTLENVVFGGPAIVPVCTTPASVPPFPSGANFEISYLSPAPSPPVRSVPSDLLTIATFYDTGCLQPKTFISFTIVKSSVTTIDVTGTETRYTAGGAVALFKTFTASDIITAGTSNYNLQGTVATSLPPAPPSGSFGLTCVYSAVAAQSCGFAAIHNGQTPALATNLGYSGLNPPFLATPSQGTVLGQAFTGAPGAMRFSFGPAPGSWVIAGSSQLVASTSGTYSFNVDSNGDIYASATQLNDPLNNAAPKFVESVPLGSFNGAVKQIDTGVDVARFTTDNNGTGSILYSDGSQQTITQFGIGP